MRLGRPAIIYHITYDDGEEVPAALTHSSQHEPRALSSKLTRHRARTHTGGRGPAHAPGTESLRGVARGAVRSAVREHAEKSTGC